MFSNLVVMVLLLWSGMLRMCGLMLSCDWVDNRVFMFVFLFLVVIVLMILVVVFFFVFFCGICIIMVMGFVWLVMVFSEWVSVLDLFVLLLVVSILVISMGLLRGNIFVLVLLFV